LVVVVLCARVLGRTVRPGHGGHPGFHGEQWLHGYVGAVARGAVSRSDLDGVFALLGSDDFSFFYPALIAAWGRRPPPAGR